MSNFWEIKKRDYRWTAIELKKHLPELKHSSIEDITDHLLGSNMGIVTQESKPIKGWVRLSLPFGLVFYAVLLLLLPVKFMFTGTWGYKSEWVTNWFKALGF
jgi:hypothetical protein